MANGTIEHPKVVSQTEWLEARKELLKREKEITRLTDEISRQRRELPWVKVEKNYVFDTPSGKKSLSELFDGRSQLIVKHFMFGPGWGEGCVGCSFVSDHVDGTLVHLEHHDVTYIAVSRAPLSEIAAFQERMGWRFQWVSSFNNDFNFDFHVSFTKDELGTGKAYYNYELREVYGEEASGFSVFYKNEAGEIFHTYSCFGRGDEKSVGTYMFLDLTPKGRNENGPRHNLTDWVRHHDNYHGAGSVAHTGRFVAAAAGSMAVPEPSPSAAKNSGCGCAKSST
jgi:predicted dithiol-disulfide oxidoreductase (DUF899 family)